ncbi:MAG: mannose-1-phosphate guanylyltransferase/mannose-6-phosphate isomerase [Acidiferrobacterales bacterium]|nr:mannose-1-phosphate guanylyltransferase/mannose-6-phosphate isomerase [Acidiferrobacterales bacterium]
MTNIYPVILSGGSGTRLWPLSRSMRPKQFINLVGESSLFQQTLERLDAVKGAQPALVVCNNEHRFMVAEQMQELGLDHNGIILEPAARNTAPAIASAAAQIAKEAPDSVMLVLPADHVIHDVAAFAAAVAEAATTATSGGLVTFGITPSYPATGYGYIKASSNPKNTGAMAVDGFVEKPDLPTAQSYLDQGDYYWNSGMFVFTAESYLSELEKHEPGMLACVNQALSAAEIDLDFLRLEESSYAESPNISIDYAVMEKSDSVSVIPLNAGWSDIGSWTSLWQSGNKDNQGNVTSGDVLLEEVSNSYVHAENKLVTALGIEDLIIVETHDGLLVTSKEHDQDIKKLVDRLKDAGRPETELHRKAFRPWGNYDCLDSGERFQVKRIMVKSGDCTSMQKHYHRAEHWIVVSGTAEVTVGDEVKMITENEAVYIPLGERHRLKNPGKVPLEIIEVQSGAYLGEDDIERFDDEYGRS